MGIAGGLAMLLAFPTEIIYSGNPDHQSPGPYPYETPVQVPAPPPVRTRRPCRRLLLFRTPNRRPIAITDSECPPATDGESRARGSIQIQWSSKFFVDFWQHFLPTLVCSIQNSEQHARL